MPGLKKIAFHGMQLLDTGSFLPVFVVMGVLFGGKPLDFRLQGFMAWQLGNAMRPKITGGCVRYDKIAFVPFPVGAAGFFRFLRFQTVTGRLGLGIGKAAASLSSFACPFRCAQYSRSVMRFLLPCKRSI